MAGDKKATATRAHGYFVAEDWHGKKEELDTRQCPHCACHFAIRPGSGKVRGWCYCCNAVTCGRAMCDACVPLLQQIANWEAGRDRFYKPIQARVPADVPKAHVKGGILLGGGS